MPDKCNQETAKEQRIEGLGAAVQRSLQLQQEKDHEAFLQQEVDIERATNKALFIRRSRRRRKTCAKSSLSRRH